MNLRRSWKRLVVVLLAATFGGHAQAAFTTSRMIKKSERVAISSSRGKVTVTPIPGHDASSVVLRAFSTDIQDQAPALAAGVGILIALAAGFVLNKDGMGAQAAESEPEPEPEPVEPVDLSIPYDAAARLAYDEWRVTHEREAHDEAEYQKFKVLYEEKTVADVIAKKKTRELEAL